MGSILSATMNGNLYDPRLEGFYKAVKRPSTYYDPVPATQNQGGLISN